jgi:hypothetical protein
VRWLRGYEGEHTSLGGVCPLDWLL